MLTKVLELPAKIIGILSVGEPVSRILPLYVGFGAVSFGMLSYPSRGVAKVLIPMFLVSGFTILYGCFVAFNIDKTRETARRIITSGASLMILTSWTRAILVYGLDQRGIGNQVLSSIVWMWITIGCCFLFISVWSRGVK